MSSSNDGSNKAFGEGQDDFANFFPDQDAPNSNAPTGEELFGPAPDDTASLSAEAELLGIDPFDALTVEAPLDLDRENIGDFTPETGEADIPVVAKGTKKGKKEKKAKTKKTAPDVRPWALDDYLLSLSGFLCAGAVVAVDAVAFIRYQWEALYFLIAFNLLAIPLVLVPVMLFRKNRKDRVNFYEVMLGLSLALVVIGCMILLYVQSIKYGTNFKGIL